MALTIRQAVEIGTRTLETGGCATPQLDAKVLMLHVLHEDDNFMIIHCGEKIGDKTLDEFFALIDERAAGKPVQYITGKQEFWKLKFSVNPHVLIPRPDTETLLERAVDMIKEISPKGNVDLLDIGCGSGAISVSLAHEFPKASVTATDISEEALAIAKKNAEANKVGKQLKFVCGDMFEPFVPKGLSKLGGGAKFDLIVSNPPYIRSDIIPTLQREVAEHEPLGALDGGPDGLDFYRIIALNAHLYMKKNSALILEIGYDQSEAVCDILEKTWKYKDIQVTQDLAGHDRVVSCRILPVDPRKKA